MRLIGVEAAGSESHSKHAARFAGEPWMLQVRHLRAAEETGISSSRTRALCGARYAAVGPSPLAAGSRAH